LHYIFIFWPLFSSNILLISKKNRKGSRFIPKRRILFVWILHVTLQMHMPRRHERNQEPSRIEQYLHCRSPPPATATELMAIRNAIQKQRSPRNNWAAPSLRRLMVWAVSLLSGHDASF
jgi:hypothetical protein